MDRLSKFYQTLYGRVFVDTCIGAGVGFIIYLIRGVVIAPYLCAVATGTVSYLRLKNVWPWNKKAGKKA